MPGPTRYAISRIQDVASSFDLFFTPDMIQLISKMTNLHGRHSVTGWSDVDVQEIRAYMELLILAGDDICVDARTQQLVPFRSHCKFQQYMPSKPAKYGLKIWVTADKERAVFSSPLAFITTNTAVSYIPHQGRKVLLSSKDREPAVHQDGKQKPQIIIDYSCCKGGVDNLDKVVSTYSCRRRTPQWPLVLFFNCIDVFTFNTFVLFTAVDPSWNQQRTYRWKLFLQELGKSMVSSEIVQGKQPQHTAATAAMVVELQTTVAALAETTDTAIATTATSSTQKERCLLVVHRPKKEVFYHLHQV
ncbi:piggyBac transposable element-derived protein 4-like protein [Lates japonicus]|uniref:PiggyBac transposable element-derived protein 4-like protein n=1 Tax=Lates japonicus TaxID=270547 RepID=A0AAD3MMI6_LATJO|nr:piggyBac transposable element-derived protein 4-like protein [Lates japonicus]